MPKLFYSKLPRDIASRYVLLLVRPPHMTHIHTLHVV